MARRSGKPRRPSEAESEDQAASRPREKDLVAAGSLTPLRVFHCWDGRNSAMPDGQKICFVVMGFGEKTDFQSTPPRVLNLDKTYEYIIEPAVKDAGLQCVRADQIIHSTLIDKPMYENLLDADVVVADLSTSTDPGRKGGHARHGGAGTLERPEGRQELRGADGLFPADQGGR